MPGAAPTQAGVTQGREPVYIVVKPTLAIGTRNCDHKVNNTVDQENTEHQSPGLPDVTVKVIGHIL